MNEDLGKELTKLCDAFDTAKDEYFRAGGKSTRAFSAIAKGRAQANPSMDELDAADKARKDFQKAVQDLSDFVKRHVV